MYLEVVFCQYSKRIIILLDFEYLCYTVDNGALHFFILGCSIAPRKGNKWKAKNWQDVRNTKGVNGEQKALSNDMEMIKTAG